jgi:hypothetical protein
LRDNGGPTLTMALLAGSPAIDAGVSAGLTTDQRGRLRPFDLPYQINLPGSDGSDIGAFELVPPLLSIAQVGNNLVVAWPATDAGYTVDFTTALPAAPGLPGHTGLGWQ